MAAHRRAKARRDEVSLVRRSVLQENEDLIRRSVRDNIAAAEIASNELDDLFADCRDVAVVRAWKGIYPDGHQGRRRTAGTCGG